MDKNSAPHEVLDVDSEHEEDDNDKEELMLPSGTFKLRPSGFKGLPPTVYVDYPSDLGIIRTDIGFIEPIGKRVLHYKCAWERNCIKNGFQRAGFLKSDVILEVKYLGFVLVIVLIYRKLDSYVVKASNR